MAENRYLPLTGGIALTTVYALTCYTVIPGKPNSCNYACTEVLLAMAWSSVARCRSVFLVAEVSGSVDTSAKCPEVWTLQH